MGIAMLHTTTSPYSNDSMDSLMLGVLVNQFLIQLLVAFFYMTETATAELAGMAIFLLLQVAVVVYGMHYIVPAVKPAFTLLYSQGLSMFKKNKEKKAHALGRLKAVHAWDISDSRESENPNNNCVDATITAPGKKVTEAEDNMCIMEVAG
ncbi:hypothetical protein CYMTET_54898 [Cymbomonas tetramitiformis]|uniref:Uncharacterized protein n=1 Tax=Cymbomonas tetramitiformis TaxID=36881 RepID=A0AAE0BE09_9CHLO|nr:hypothetical protein CYMTET_54898 [Cymbomonas tetramitiformis]